MSRRAAIVDDTSPKFAHAGKWKPRTYSPREEDSFIWGLPINHTTTILDGTEGSFAIQSNGTFFFLDYAIAVLEEGQSVFVTCFVDGRRSASEKVYRGPLIAREHEMADCDTTGNLDLDDGVHQVVLNITASHDSKFELDSLEHSILPPGRENDTISRESEIISLPAFDANVTISPQGWETISTHITRGRNAEITVSFTGIGIMVDGIGVANSTTATSSYILDGGNPVDFVIPGWVGTTDRFHIPFVELRNLLYETHSRMLRYTGDPTRSPMKLQGFHVYEPSVSLSASPTIGRPPESSTTLGGISRTSSLVPTPRPVAAIAGGVVGGVLRLALMLGILPYLRKHRRHYNGVPSPTTAVQESAVNPFIGQGAMFPPAKPPIVFSSRNPSLEREKSLSSSPSSSTLQRPDSGDRLDGQQAVAHVPQDRPIHPSTIPPVMHPGVLRRHEDSGIRIPRTMLGADGSDSGLPPMYSSI